MNKKRSDVVFFVTMVIFFGLVACAMALLATRRERLVDDVTKGQHAPAKPKPKSTGSSPLVQPVTPIDPPNDGSDSDDGEQTDIVPTRPIVCVLGAEWCAPCRRVERNVLPLLGDDLDVRIIDAERDKDLVAKLIDPREHAFPQFVLCEHAADGTELRPIDWLTGYHDVDDVRAFVAADHPHKTQCIKEASCQRIAPITQSPRVRWFQRALGACSSSR